MSWFNPFCERNSPHMLYKVPFGSLKHQHDHQLTFSFRMFSSFYFIFLTRASYKGRSMGGAGQPWLKHET
jgi:hypothetical protein